MNDAPILDGLDPEIVDTFITRRDAIAKSGRAGGLLAVGAALGSMPIALAALSREVHGQTPTAQVLSVLQFALLLENLESEFYKAVLGTSSVTAFNNAFAPVRATLTTTDRATFQIISQHEIAHVAFLETAIRGAGGTPTTYVPQTTFDFTGGRGTGTGPFAPATTSRDFLLAATQGFEDTGVRAYKGQAGNLLRTDTLTAALQIHAVEARHAARVRRMRRASSSIATADVRYSGVVRNGGATAAGVSNAASLPAAVQSAFAAIYANEGSTSHVVNNGSADVTLTQAQYSTNVPTGADYTQAFDEALTRAEVVAIVQPFVIPPIPAA